MEKLDNSYSPMTTNGGNVSSVSNRIDDLLPSDKEVWDYLDKYGKPNGTYLDELMKNLFSFGQYGKMESEKAQKTWEFMIQKYFKDYDTALANSEIQRRVKDALAAGVNPVFALGQQGAGDGGSVAHVNNSSKGSSDNGMMSILKIIMMMMMMG